MFKLHEPLETAVDIQGEIYEVNTSFDNILQLLDRLQNPRLTDGEKIADALMRLLGTQLDLEIDQQVKVFHALMDHFVHGEEGQEAPVDLEGNVMPVAARPPTYDLTHDAPYIYTSFQQAYGINLLEAQGKLDWRLFKLLLRDLPEDTKFKQVIDIRTRPYPKGKGLSEERRRLKEAKRAFALPGHVLDD